MPSLKALRTRINSVKSTQKITSAMKMVAASKLRRAQNQVESARPYAQRMARMLSELAANVAVTPSAPRLLVGTGRDQVHLVVPITADRGLAGAFNANVGRASRALLQRLEAEGKTVKLLPIGRKGRDYLRRDYGSRIVHEVSLAGRKRLEFADVLPVTERIVGMLEAGEFDVCTLVYNRFISVISQQTTTQQIVPVRAAVGGEGAARTFYDSEPDEETVLASLLPQNLATQIFTALLESAAGEHGARMSAMDSATRNAGDMINRLSLNYNRTRQANITKELIEIISGAEAV